MTNERVLLVVDAQVGFRDENYWGVSANPSVHAKIASLVKYWRDREWPVVLVKHNSINPLSPLSPLNPGNSLETYLDGPRDVLIQKSVNSAFYGTPDLHLWMTKRNYRSLVICGITTNFCCETTARMAGNLGYNVDFIIDATSTFDRKDLDGGVVSGLEVMRTSAANLNGEFAQVWKTAEFLDHLSQSRNAG